MLITPEYDILGCMDLTANNYNPEATIDDGSCDYCEEGSSFILLSTDGGETWEFNCPKEEDIGLTFQISVIDTNNIWIASKKLENGNHYEALLYSSDKGKSWEEKYRVPYQVYQDGGAGMDEVFFADENNGIIVIDEPNIGPQFYRTYDGGKSWNRLQTPPTEGSLRNHERVDLVDINTLFFINTSVLPRIFYGSSTLGAPWDTTHFSDAIHVEFYDKNIGLVAGHRNAYRTNDGGKTWESFPFGFLNDSDDIYWGYGIRFSNNDPKSVWLLDDHNIHFSSDTGRTWISYPYDNGYAYDMHVYNHKAWIVGGGTLRYSDDATTGVWTDISLPDQPLPIKMFPEAIGGYKDEVIVTTGSF